MADRCPTCGEPVTVATGTEGTSHYESAARAEIARLQEAWAKAVERADHFERGFTVASENSKRDHRRAEALKEAGEELATHTCDNEFDNCRVVRRFKRAWQALDTQAREGHGSAD